MKPQPTEITHSIDGYSPSTAKVVAGIAGIVTTVFVEAVEPRQALILARRRARLRLPKVERFDIHSGEILEVTY